MAAQFGPGQRTVGLQELALGDAVRDRGVDQSVREVQRGLGVRVRDGCVTQCLGEVSIALEADAGALGSYCFVSGAE
ncbi:hypothetical protein AQJ46_02445 [Streptomyces canus]|uniref:Uncharacterized protein n=1 Tax=Streptomyces canus TaxID=58343 RepID=A0A101SIS3_9ACTN|nr:hypothetical protein AQJ46_02445 [Streptomyces canus]